MCCVFPLKILLKLENAYFWVVLYYESQPFGKLTEFILKHILTENNL